MQSLVMMIVVVILTAAVLMFSLRYVQKRAFQQGWNDNRLKTIMLLREQWEKEFKAQYVPPQISPEGEAMLNSNSFSCLPTHYSYSLWNYLAKKEKEWKTVLTKC